MLTRLPGGTSENGEALIRAAIGGDEAAFEQIVARHQRQVYRVARAIVGDDVDADAVTQDTFIQAYRNLAGFEGRSQLETWLTRIAINLARDVLRRRKHVQFFVIADREDAPALDIADERPDPERQMSSSQLGAAIARAERNLSAGQQVVFRLRHHAGLSLEEIAARLELRPSTVRVHLFRAMKKIRKELGCWRRQPIRETIDVRAFQ